MASAASSSTPLSLSSASAIKAPPRLPAAVQCVSLLAPPHAPGQSCGQLARTTAYCGKIARNVAAMATGEAQAEVVAATATREAPAEVVAAPAETSEIVKTIQEAWDKLDDKYAVTSLAVAGGVALWASAGMISAIDRLPLVPGVLELVGIGYTGWFAYRNLASKPERDALIKKIKDTYNNVIGSS